jgi:hypothetical protein
MVGFVASKTKNLILKNLYADSASKIRPITKTEMVRLFLLSFLG